MIFPIMTYSDSYLTFEHFDEECFAEAIKIFEERFQARPDSMFISSRFWANSMMSPMTVKYFLPSSNIDDVKEGKVGIMFDMIVVTDIFNEPKIVNNEIIHKANVDFNIQLSNNNNWLNCKFGV